MSYRQAQPLLDHSERNRPPGRKTRARAPTARRKCGSKGRSRGEGTVGGFKLARAAGGHGVGVLIAAIRREGKAGRLEWACLEEAGRTFGGRFTARIVERADPRTVARLTTALAHVQRIAIAIAILNGHGRLKNLQAKLGLKAGPLYHHLRAMERCGVLECPARGAYTLTEIGRLCLMTMSLLSRRGRGGRRIWQRRSL